MQRQNAKGKQRSFIDRQEGAQRVSFDDDSQPFSLDVGLSSAAFPARSSAPGPYHIGTPRGSKRPYRQVEPDYDDFDPTQDEGFQTDTRDTTAADARRLAAPRPQPSLHRPAPAANTVDYEYPGSVHATPSTSKRPRLNPGSTLPDPLPDLDPDAGLMPREQFYQRAKALAKHGRLVASSQKPPQTRVPWSEEEESALIDLVVRFGGDGVSYAALKKRDAESEGRVLWRRSGEDMRFKARNMKQTFIL